MYSLTSRVRYSECDEHLRLSLPGILNYLQDCSMFHCEHVGHGFDYCTDKGFAWFVLAWQIRIDRRPAFGEPLTVKTCCYDMTPTLAKRCFTIEDENGSTIVMADSLVVAFDLGLGRAARIPESELSFVEDALKPDLPPTKRKIRLAGPHTVAFEQRVTEHLIDSNEHVNNVQYIALAEQAIHQQERDFEPHMLYVQYKVAAHLGDTIVAHRYVEDAGYGVDLTDPDGKSFSTIRMTRA